LKVQRSRAVAKVTVTTDGKNLVSHAGAALLAELADRVGLTVALSEAMADCGIAWRHHDPGVVLTHLAVAMADGADCLADFAAVREQAELFGPVASVPTAWRVLHHTAVSELRAIPEALAAARGRVWAAAPPAGPVVLDIDSTLVEAHSPKEDAAPTYTRGFGFSPMAVFCDNTAEPLAAMLRPGNASPYDSDDHLELFDRALRALPPEQRRGPIVVRADSAAASKAFVDELSFADVEYSIGFQMGPTAKNALLLAQEEDWVPALEADGSARHGAEVIELSELAELWRWPPDVRLIARRERPLPGAQLSLFDTVAGWRHTCFITNSDDADIAALELRHRGHARVEDRIRAWKDCGLANLPFEGFCANEAWLAVSLVALNLVAWSQLLCFEGSSAVAELKTVRHRLLHVAAVLARRGRRLFVRLDQTWPWSDELVAAFGALRGAFP
jgi:hypothetical protein